MQESGHKYLVDYPDPYGSPTKLSKNLARIFHYSAILCADRESSLSYSSILLCFTIAPDDLSLRFRHYAERANLKKMAQYGKFDLGRLSEIPGIKRQFPITFGIQDKSPWGRNLIPVFDRARQHSEMVTGDGIVGVRHLMAAYVYDAEASRQKLLRSWDLDPLEWANWFMGQMEALRPGEIETWRKLDASMRSHLQPPVRLLPLANTFAEEATTPQFLDRSSSEAKAQQTGPSFVSDRWAEIDRLGYAQYAYALYRFLVHPSTELPLAVSVQAPWGGGKTSMMKLVRSYMDKEAELIDGSTRPEDGREASATRLTLGEVLRELEKLFEKKPCTLARPVGERHGGRITIWFNPWKYENTEQVWAGLADAIISSVSRRLPPIEREVFWLRLNLSRIDVDKLRAQIHNSMLEKASSAYRRWLYVTVSVTVFTLASIYFTRDSLISSGILGFLGAAFPILTREVTRYVAESKAEAEPAALSLKDLVSIPNYSQKAGLIHEVTKDLSEVMKVIGKEPIVIFVDDLDRCSPKATAQVFDGLNRFVSGEFINCIMVMGMDDAVVAQSLSRAYETLAPTGASHGDVATGWKFMDKFIQVPFQLPQPAATVLKSYKRSLLRTTGRKDLVAIFSRGLAELDAKLPIPAATDALRSYAGKNKLDEIETDELIREHATRHLVDERFATFENESTDICSHLDESLPSFLTNPRDIKRCINSTKFQFFVTGGQNRKDAVEILLARVILGLRWPQVIRFLTKVRHLDEELANPLHQSVRDLKASAYRATDFAKWRTVLATKWEVPNGTQWTDDEELYEFLRWRTRKPQSRAKAANRNAP